MTMNKPHRSFCSIADSIADSIDIDVLVLNLANLIIHKHVGIEPHSEPHPSLGSLLAICNTDDYFNYLPTWSEPLNLHNGKTVALNLLNTIVADSGWSIPSQSTRTLHLMLQLNIHQSVVVFSS